MQLDGLSEFIGLKEHMHFLILFSASISRLMKSCREGDVKGDELLFHVDLSQECSITRTQTCYLKNPLLTLFCLSL